MRAGLRTVKGHPAYVRAEKLLAAWLEGQQRVTLGHATRELERLDRASPIKVDLGQDLAGRIDIELVSRLLRGQGFRKIGIDGHGCHREPVYLRMG